MIIAVPKETCPGENRVALVPSLIPPLLKAEHKIYIEKNAGAAAGYPDGEYLARGAMLADHRSRLFQDADVLFMVKGPGANPEKGQTDLQLLKPGQVLIAFLDPLSAPDQAQALARKGVTAFALELVPRITRAQSMDALSSMCSLIGYKAVLLAANALPKIFPMMITAAGSLVPAKVFVIGAGVTGLQACATAKRLGALVSAYDIRPAVREQVQSVGAQFVDFGLEVDSAEEQSGYAKAQSDSFYKRQQAEMAKVIAASDVVITTAAVPGKRAPILVTAEMVRGMAQGSVLVDAAAENGGNCELTEPGKTVVRHGITIIGALNLPATLPYHASQMVAKNIAMLFAHLTDRDGCLIDRCEDEIATGAALCRNGQIINPQIRAIAGLPPLEDTSNPSSAK